jgi:hypothetical protein
MQKIMRFFILYTPLGIGLAALTYSLIWLQELCHLDIHLFNIVILNPTKVERL